jgi:hypothetical protein
MRRILTIVICALLIFVLTAKADEKGLPIGEVEIGNAESPLYGGDKYVLPVPCKATIVAKKDAKGVTSFEISSLSTENDKRFKILIPKSQTYEQVTPDMPNPTYAVGDRFVVGYRDEFEVKQVQLMVEVAWERTDASGKEHQVPRLVATAMVRLQGTRKVYKVTDTVTKVTPDGTPIFERKETFYLSHDTEVVAGPASKPVPVKGEVPQRFMPHFATKPIPPYPDLFTEGRAFFDVSPEKEQAKADKGN